MLHNSNVCYIYFNCFILLQLTVFDSLELTVFLVVLRRREEADIQCPLDTAGYPEMKCTVCTVQCTVRANATWHPACLTKKLLSLTDIYCQSSAQPGPGTPVMVTSGSAEALNSHHPQQIRSDTIQDMHCGRKMVHLKRYFITTSSS